MKDSPIAPLRPVQSGLLRKSGDLLQATEDFIVHQCNCARAAGSSEVLLGEFWMFKMLRAHVARLHTVVASIFPWSSS